MRKHRRNLLLAALLALTLFGALAWLALPTHEPAYQGKTLSEWLMTPGTNGVFDIRWQEAVRQIGTNGIPTLLQMLRAHDSKLKLQLIALAESQDLVKFHFVSAARRNGRASDAFIILGPTASNAVPDLIGIFKERVSDSSRQWAVASLGYIGPTASSAVPALLHTVGDTNANEYVRDHAMEALVQIQADPGLVVPALIKCLQDPDQHVQTYAELTLRDMGSDAKSGVPALVDLMKDPNPRVKGLAEQALEKISPELVVPILIKRLKDKDSDSDVRYGAAADLPFLGSAAKAAVPALIDALNDPDPDVRKEAKYALKTIDPEAAAKAGIK